MKDIIDSILWLSVFIFVYVCAEVEAAHHILWNIISDVEPWWFKLQHLL